MSHALGNQRVHHGFLFTGTRGVGKTTIARIFAKALNCESGISVEPCGECAVCRGIDEGSFIDLIEVDAASRTKVDDTRELLDNVQYTPSIGRYKIYLIDEVHMLSTHSFNALLKTLEEPPDHVKFLLATTDPQKLPATILSRCIQFNLRSMNARQLTGQLEAILRLEKIEFELPALELLARSGNGSVRDALSLLDQAIAYGNGAVTRENVRNMLGMIDNTIISGLLKSILDGDAQSSINAVAGLSERAADYGAALDDLLLLIHNVALYQVAPDAARWKDVDIEEVTALAESSDPETLQLLYQIGLAGKRDLDYAPDPYCGFEMVVLRMLAFLPEPKAPSERGRGQARGTGGPAPPAKPTSQGKTEKPGSDEAPVSARRNRLQKAEPSGEPPGDCDGSSSANPGGSAAPSEGKRNAWSETDLAGLLEPSRWEALIEDLEVDGITRQMLRHMVPRSIDGSTIHVRITSEPYRSEDRVKEIERMCKGKLGLPIRFKLLSASESGNGGHESESLEQRDQRQGKERQKRAESLFEQDSIVRELVDTFGGNVESQSIVPGVGR